MMQTLWQDIRFTVRQMRRAPFFTLTVTLTLALAVGATAVMAGVLRATLLNPLPYPHAEELVQIGDANLRGFKTNGLTSLARIDDLKKMQHNGRAIFSTFSFYYLEDGVIRQDGHAAVSVAKAAVSGDFFRTLGVDPLLGRTIGVADDVQGAPKVVVLSFGRWTSSFARDPGVVGRVVMLGTQQATVIGVMPERFNQPAGTDLWFPREVFYAWRGDGGRFLNAIARLALGATMADASQQADLLATQLARAYPETDAAWGFHVMDLRTELFGSLARVLKLLAAAVGLVLLVAAVNIAGLQLSRNAVRTPEFAIRSALGVSRGRLMRQLLTESVLLVMVGSMLGVAVGAVVMRVLTTRLPPELLSVERPHLDGTVLAATLLVALVVGVLTGLIPALQSARASLVVTGGVGRGRTRLLGRTFSVVQMALALTLLTLSATVLQGLYGLMHTRLGFDAEQLQSCSVNLGWDVENSKRHEIYKEVERRLAGLPGVTDVGSVLVLPLSDFSIRNKYDIAGQAPTPEHDAIVAEGRAFSPGYLRTMRIPLLAGRSFTERDGSPNMPHAIVVNQTLAARYFAGKNAVGQHLISTAGVKGDATQSSEIVGVVGDVRGTGGLLTASVQPEVYGPEDGSWPHMQFAIRSNLPAETIEPEVRRVVAEVNATASVTRYTTLSKTLEGIYQQPRLNAALLAGFAGLSVLLVVIGVYGLLSFDFAQRTRELGLRLALGATREGVLRLLLSESLSVLIAGLVLGLAGSWAASRLLMATLPGAAEHTGLLLVVVIAVLSIAVLLATIVPARRAAMTDPMQALRAE